MMMVPAVSLPGFSLGERVQLAFVVADLESALRYWTGVMGVGPFVVIENSVAGRKVLHRGQPSAMDTTLAFAYMGDVQIEIVHPSNDAPSPFREFLDSGREGLQHIAFWPDDLDKACQHLEQAGFSEVCAMYLDDGSRNVCYYQPPSALGVMIEIVPWTAARQAYFSRIQRLSRNWDGQRPVRRFRSREDFLASGEGALPSTSSD